MRRRHQPGFIPGQPQHTLSQVSSGTRSQWVGVRWCRGECKIDSTNSIDRALVVFKLMDYSIHNQTLISL